MIKKLVTYKVKKGSEDIVIQSIERFINAIIINEPGTKYEAFKSANEREFIHIMTFPDHISELRHNQAEYTRDFIEDIYLYCEITPQFVDLYAIKN
ncbi:MAG: hypothetical protein ACRENO_01495 [Thermodesulfobacteriota bacterium]